MLVKHSITVLTSGTTATAYTPKLNGKLLRIRYVKVDYTAGVDFTITGDDTGESLWTDTNVDASEVVRPRIDVHDQAGVQLTRDGTRVVCEPYELVDERIKIAIAQAGDAETGIFHFIIEQ